MHTAHQLAPLAAAFAPEAYAQWAQQARESAVLGILKRPDGLAAVRTVNSLRDECNSLHSLAQWLVWLRGALTACGLWSHLKEERFG